MQSQLLGTGVTTGRCCDTWHEVTLAGGAGAVGRAQGETLVSLRLSPGVKESRGSLTWFLAPSRALTGGQGRPTPHSALEI